MLSKKELLDCGQAELNEYREKDWFRERGCRYDPIWNEERFDTDNVQGHFGLSSDGKTLFVIIRGSDENKDWKGNFRFGLIPTEEQKLEVITNTVPTNVMVHAGFQEAYKTVKKKLMDKASPFLRVVICGHSLGAAIAVLFAENLTFHFPGKEVYCVPLACPLVGNEAFMLRYLMRVRGSYHIWYGDDTVVRGPQNAILLMKGYRGVQRESHIWKNYFLPWNWITFLMSWPNDHYPDLLLSELRKRLAKYEDHVEFSPGVDLR